MTEQSNKPSAKSRLALAGVLLAVGAATSIAYLVYAVRHEAGVLILWLGLASVGLIFASSVCLFFALGRFFQSRQLRSQSVDLPVTINVTNDYVAEYSNADRGVALVIAGFFGALTLFFLLRSTRMTGSILSGLFFGLTVAYAVRSLVTRVRFTRQGIVARSFWQRELSEPYDRIQRVSGKPGSLKIQFSDGHSLTLHAGLGNADAIITYLQANCPESVQIE